MVNLKILLCLIFQSNRDPLSRLQAENNGNSHSPNVINVDVDSSELARHTQSANMSQKPNITLNHITDAVIAKDPSFGAHAQHLGFGQLPPGSINFIRQSIANSMQNKTPSTQSIISSGSMGQEQIVSTDQWNRHRRIQQQQQKEEMAKSGNNGGPQGRSTPDDRQIIRMAQTPSPRNKIPYEPVSPPESQQHYYQQQAKPLITINANDQRRMQSSSQPGQENAGDANMVLTFVNNRIAEAMRDGLGSEHHDGKDGHKTFQSRDNEMGMKTYERPRSGNSMPGNGMPENDSDKSSGKRESPHNSVYINQQSTRPSPQPNQSYQPPQSVAYMYPFSALTIPPGANPIISTKAASELIESNRQQQAPAPPSQHHETRQVLSEQYDALSDEE